MSELASELDEQRLEGELGRQVQLLEPSPGLAHGLGGPLRPEQALPRRVLAKHRQLVEVDRRAVRAHRDGHEVAVPRAELLELRQQLLSLGAARRPLHALLSVARAQLELRDAGLLVVARFVSTPLGVLEQRGSSLRGVERLRR